MESGKRKNPKGGKVTTIPLPPPERELKHSVLKTSSCLVTAIGFITFFLERPFHLDTSDYSFSSCR